ncbi:class I SAM-dependent DNA methyltransferase [Enterovibrio norvegicus]|uniref:class I SAM-dependent DNA methyltransferase n=1 Tax=Enterovibrio norvegicus TaxID=188144 RepID=UPI000310A127|nr:class I SAM-dependent methyltransferase [Enterovibrio norvegicus]OEE68662.1 methyltransferase [Enterovibrio norvegicus]TKF35350.1 class I SAM-dependent methyltransferase [Enterovibrio norvegicus]
MSKSWDDMAAEWDSNAAVIAYSEKVASALANVVAIKGSKILDFGCGTGLLTEKLSPKVTSITAIDPSVEMINALKAKDLPNVSTVIGVVDEIFVREYKQAGQRFDVIVASSSLAFVPDYQETIALLAMLLVDGGLLVQWDWEKSESSGAGFTVSEIEEAYTDAGLNVISTSIPFNMGDMRVLMGVGQRTA